MKFSDLLNLKYDRKRDIIPIKVLRKNGVAAPEEVLIQFYSDHGRKESFQDQYADLDLERIIWEERKISGKEIIDCSYYKEFSSWYEAVKSRSNDWKEKSWDCIDVRSNVVSNWKENNSWNISPVFINGSLIQSNNKYHLVEGHTRVAILNGLIDIGIISESFQHIIWYGDYIK